MLNVCTARKLATALAAIGMVSTSSAQAESDWSQWGGPRRDFTTTASGLSGQWPEDGPRKLWSREIGDGFSTIVTNGTTLYTMMRGQNDREVVIALNAGNGETVWEYTYPAPFLEAEVDEYDEKTGEKTGKKKTQKQVTKFGEGPNSTPLLVDGRLYTIGFTGKMHCLDAATGSVVWAHDLFNDIGANYLMFGWATSPIAYEDSIIVLVGGKGRGVMAFDKADGKVRWKSTDYDASYSSPILVKVDGEDHLVAYMASDVIGLSPKDGKLHWSTEHKNEYNTSIGTPISCPGQRLFFVNGGDEAGGRLVHLAKKDGKIQPREIWTNRKIKGGLNNAVLVGNYLYGPNSAGEGARFMVAISIEDGQIKWREREVTGAKGVFADGKLIILDHDGRLMLTTPSSRGLKIHSSIQALEKEAWTTPTLVGKTLYLRDRKTIMAMDLG